MIHHGKWPDLLSSCVPTPAFRLLSSALVFPELPEFSVMSAQLKKMFKATVYSIPLIVVFFSNLEHLMYARLVHVH